MSQPWWQALPQADLQHLLPTRGLVGGEKLFLPGHRHLAEDDLIHFTWLSIHLCFFLFLSRDLRIPDSIRTTFLLPKAWQDTDRTGRNRISSLQKAEHLLAPFQDGLSLMIWLSELSSLFYLLFSFSHGPHLGEVISRAS